MERLTTKMMLETLSSHLGPHETINNYSIGTSGVMTTIPKIIIFSVCCLLIPIFGIIIGVFLGFFVFSKHFFIGLTDEKLILVQVSSFKPSFHEKAVYIYRLHEITSVANKKAIFGRLFAFSIKDGNKHKILMWNKPFGLTEQPKEIEAIAQLFSSITIKN